jgi:tetratricopeptide (TPR) repeat protein
MDAFSYCASLRTTDSSIAISNLEAQIDGLELGAGRGELNSAAWSELVDLILLRAQILGHIADYERASALAEQRAVEARADARGLLARARTRAALHRFDEALNDIDTAERLGSTGRQLEAERAAILQAVGRYDEALALRRVAAEHRADFESLAGLASLHAELGEIAAAETCFDESFRCFRSVSPFPIAQLEFQRGHMWLKHNDLKCARHWFEAAWRRLPAFAQAECHLAEVEYGLGERNGAILRLRRLASVADDPDYAAQLARMLAETDLAEEASVWHKRAEERYEQLVARHPEAFADHAADFWLSVGNEPQRALSLAQLNLKVRNTPGARALVARATKACRAPVWHGPKNNESDGTASQRQSVFSGSTKLKGG